MINVLLISKKFLLAECLLMALNKEPYIRAVTVSDFETSIETFLIQKVDIVILDLSVPFDWDSKVYEYIKKKKPHIKIIAISNSSTTLAFEITHTISEYDTLLTIKKLIYSLSQNYSDYLHYLENRLDTSYKYKLTPKELEILHLMIKGYDNSYILHSLNIYPTTLATHKSHIMEKLKVTNSNELIVKVIREKIIDLP